MGASSDKFSRYVGFKGRILAGLRRATNRVNGDSNSWLRREIGLAEFMAGLMVLATVFSAIAAWRATTISSALYDAAERPYFGVSSVALARPGGQDAEVLVTFRNFGKVESYGTRIGEKVFVDGKPPTGGTFKLDAGILSPFVPHRIFVYLPSDEVGKILSGETGLSVVVTASYRGPVDPTLCYAERFAYVPAIRSFQVDGGSTRCARTNYWSKGGPRR